MNIDKFQNGRASFVNDLILKDFSQMVKNKENKKRIVLNRQTARKTININAPYDEIQA